MRTKKWAKPELAVCPFYIKNATEYKNRWSENYKKNQPMWLELGCGKGSFLSQIASKNPNKNFLAVDLSSDMLGLTKRNIEFAYAKVEMAIDNVLITWQNIEQIDGVLGKDDNVERIFINFCNPWFKYTQHKKRLTHSRQLLKYRQFLTDDAEIWFKTDDDDLFEHSLIYFAKTGFDILYKTYDLHESGFQPNYKTEHEAMYSEQGIKIKFLIARKIAKE